MSLIKTRFWVIKWKTISHTIIVNIVGCWQSKYTTIIHIGITSKELLTQAPVCTVEVAIVRTTEDRLCHGTVYTLTRNLTILTHGIEVIAILLKIKQTKLSSTTFYQSEQFTKSISCLLTILLII